MIDDLSLVNIGEKLFRNFVKYLPLFGLVPIGVGENNQES